MGLDADIELPQPFTIVAAGTTLVSAYGSTVRGQLSMERRNAVAIQVAYTKGDETSMQIKVEASLDGTNFYQQVAESTSGGTITDTVVERSFSASGSYALLISPVAAKVVRISAKATSGTPNGTVGITAVPYWS